MGRIVVTEYVSVDGVAEAPSGTEDFERVGWTDPFSRGPEGDQSKFDETMASDALLLDRLTYEGFAPVWPEVEGEFAHKFNGMPKYVISSTLVDPEWNNTMVLRGVVDALHLMIYPVIVGAGKRLFAETSETKRLRLVESKTVNDGITILVYQRAAGTGDRS
jgi:dihydrofolate reductase